MRQLGFSLFFKHHIHLIIKAHFIIAKCVKMLSNKKLYHTNGRSSVSVGLKHLRPCYLFGRKPILGRDVKDNRWTPGTLTHAWEKKQLIK